MQMDYATNHDAGLPALGINRHISRTIAYGPRRYQGLGILDLWTLQGILKLWLAVAHGDAPTITGCSLRAVLSLHMVELGLPGSFLTYNYAMFSHLTTNSWLKQLWHFCRQTDLCLVPSIPPIQPAREHDQFLMLIFSRYGYRSTSLYHLNLCRLWCHAVRLSDVVTSDGFRLHPLSWNGQPHDDTGRDIQWPTHGRPTPKCWCLWQSALRLCFLTTCTTQQTL